MVRGKRYFVITTNVDGQFEKAGFNTPVIIRFPFERMATQFPQTTLVRSTRDYPQLTTEGVKRFISFTGEIRFS